MRARVSSAIGPMLILLGLNCSSGTQLVASGPHRPNVEPSPKEVKEPPPPAVIETLPLHRNKECSYLDGHFRLRNNDWKWSNGKWVIPPKGCYFAAPVTRYEKLERGTTLVHREGIRLPKNLTEKKRCADPKPCPSEINPD